MPRKPYLELTYRGQARRLGAMAREALARFGLTDASRPRLLFHGENTTFEARAPTGRYVIRVHRPGYQPEANIRSEMDWLDALARDTDLHVPRPRVGLDGERVQTITVEGVPEPRHVVLFEWIDGARFQKKRRTQSDFHAIGALCARLHAHAAAWTPPEGFTRHRLDEEGLLGAEAIWGDPRQIEALTPPQRRLVTEAADALQQKLVAFGKGPDRFGLVHADLHTGNVLMKGGVARAIDFDDAAFSWHAYDACVCLQHDWRAPERAELLQAWLQGYRGVRPFPQAQVDVIEDFMMVRRLMILSWLDQRRDNPKLREILTTRLTPAIEELKAYMRR
ncbi:phosphotransferase [Myxococcota bacterium]|nr:phosphotransferase [Myxococcota bacterium]MBU1896337.1 phosphotransferase [Myxococcota bacterium]